ncbi:hypothetical protein EB821_01580 [Candidatus Marinimicrobia bacterium PRS2]|nr:hypothetical protein EB821_01580 [Candidatus Marinimicrobia bacterium PRS2]
MLSWSKNIPYNVDISKMIYSQLVYFFGKKSPNISYIFNNIKTYSFFCKILQIIVNLWDYFKGK